MVTVDDVRAVLAGLPRSSEVLVRDRVKFRVGQIVYVAFSQEETEIGFAFPKEERAALAAARPDVFFLTRESELRFHWIEAWLDTLDADEMRELVLDAVLDASTSSAAVEAPLCGRRRVMCYASTSQHHDPRRHQP